jgi:peptidoglycan/LPS O-acetylase OafA/YrhL
VNDPTPVAPASVSRARPASSASTASTGALAPRAPREVAPDVLRGVSILLVVVYHAYPRLLPGGGVVGVVTFFTLSGYLITGTLLSEQRRTGHIDLLAYARRRAVRLWPAVLAVLVGITLVTLLLDPLGDRDGLGRALLVGATLTVDLPIGIGSPTWSGPLSLAITAVLARASWVLVERPALDRWAHPRRNRPTARARHA